MTLTDVRILDSVTQLDGSETGVVVGASHGGRYAGYLAARAGARGVILHDAGVGKDDAGIESLPYLAELGVAGVTIAAESARIGDGLDLATEGAISHVNGPAADLGCATGQSTLACAAHMREGEPPGRAVPEYGQASFQIDSGTPPVWGFDSLSLIEPDHEGTIAITASHGARLAGERTSYLAADVAAAAFNDAGGGLDGAGTSRLPVLGDRGIPAVAVGADTARIGDARSSWESGRVSEANGPARDAGVEPGDDLPTVVEKVRRWLD